MIAYQNNYKTKGRTKFEIELGLRMRSSKMYNILIESVKYFFSCIAKAFTHKQRFSIPKCKVSLTLIQLQLQCRGIQKNIVHYSQA